MSLTSKRLLRCCWKSCAIGSSILGIGGLAAAEPECYTVPTLHRTFFKLDENRQFQPYIKNGKKFYEVEETEHISMRRIYPKKSMLIVMDPWVDVGNELLNQHCRKAYDAKLLPTVKQFIALGIPVTVLTNGKDKDGYGYDVFPELEELQKSHRLQILYHAENPPEKFARQLKDQGIDTLIYCGFFTNMCVIGRPLGIIRMGHEGFRIFFIPEAAAAIEHGKGWETQEIHEAVTFALSQWAVELMKVDDLLKLKPLSATP